MHFSRKTILVVGAAMLAACGDKVSVTEYTPPAVTTAPVVLKVNSVSVAPVSATLNIGQSITLTAAVNADVGLATTVSWSASAANVTVTSAGVVTAVTATPGVAVCATSTVDAGKKGCASIVVSAQTAAIPATVSINSITKTGFLSQTVDPTNVTGSIDVTLNINPGNQTITKVELLVGGVVAGTQTFTAAQAAALRFASDEAIAAQTTFPQVIFTVNTAAFAAGTGVATYPNGNKAISAKVYTAAGGTTAAASATAAANLAFANPDVLSATVAAPAGSFVTATSVLGYLWSKIPDSLDVTILPVMYSGRTVSSIAMRPVCGDSIWTKVMTPFKVRYGVPATGYQTTNSAGGCSATAQTDGEGPIYVSAIMADGNSAPALAIDATVATSLRKRYDNVGPAAPTISLARNGRTGNWVNGTIGLTTVNSSTALDGIVTTATFADAGVSAGTASTDAAFQTFKAFSQSTAPFSTAGTLTALTSPSALGESAAANSYCLVVRAYDALGNVSPLPAINTTCVSPTEGATTFGVDLTAPVARWVTTGGYAQAVAGTIDNYALADGEVHNNTAVLDGRAGAAPAYKLAAVVYDSVPASGVSSGLSTLGSYVRITRTNNAGTVNLTSGLGSFTAASSSNPNYPSAVFVGSIVAATNTINFNVEGTASYYSVGSWVIKDNAGNTASSLATRTAMYDAVAPTVAMSASGTLSSSSTSVRNINITSDEAGLGLAQVGAAYTLGATSAASTGSIASAAGVATLTVTAAGTSLKPGDVLESAGATVKPGTIITAQLTGAAGSTGTYTVNLLQTMGAGTFTVASDMYRCASPISLNSGKTSSAAVYSANSNGSCVAAFSQLAQTAAVGNPAAYYFNVGANAAAALNVNAGGFRAWASDVAGNLTAPTAAASAGTVTNRWLNGGAGGTSQISNRVDGSTVFLDNVAAGGTCSTAVAGMDTVQAPFAASMAGAAGAVNLCNRLDYNWVQFDSVTVDTPSATTVYSGASGSTPISTTLGAKIYTRTFNGRNARSAAAVVVDTAVTGTAAGAIAADSVNPMSLTVKFYAQDARGNYISAGTGVIADSTIAADAAIVGSVWRAQKMRHYTLAWTPGTTFNRSYWSGTTYNDYAPGSGNKMYAIVTGTAKYVNTMQIGGTTATDGCFGGTSADGVTAIVTTQLAEAVLAGSATPTGCPASSSVGIKSRPFFVTVNP